MTKGTFVFFTGILLIILPYLGIPSLWKHYIGIGLGVLLIILGYIIRRRQFLDEMQRAGEQPHDTFVETTQDLFSTRVE